MLKDPSLLDESIRGYAALPGGHGEAWADAFRNLVRNIYTFIGERRSMESDREKIDFPTFEDGLESNCVVGRSHERPAGESGQRFIIEQWLNGGWPPPSAFPIPFPLPTCDSIGRAA